MVEAAEATPGSEAAPAVAPAGDAVAASPAEAAVAAAPTFDPLANVWAESPAPEPEQAAQEARPEDAAAKDESGLPEVYNVALPEGAQVDPNLMALYQGALKEGQLTQEQADKFTPIVLSLKEKWESIYREQWADTTRAWRQSVESDPEIGGSKLKQALVHVAIARDNFSNPEFRALMADQSLGLFNHPGLIKFMAAVGAANGEDLRGADKPGSGVLGERDMSAGAIGRRMFPSMNA